MMLPIGEESFEETGLSRGSQNVETCEPALAASWRRLVDRLGEEEKALAEASLDVIPRIDFKNISEPSKAVPFLDNLRFRGLGIIRNVVSEDETRKWTSELHDYVANHPGNNTKPDVFWSPAQVSSRAHPNVLAVQKFVMSGCWSQGTHGEKTNGDHSSSSSTSSTPSSSAKPKSSRGLPPPSRVSTNFPVVYADRLQITHHHHHHHHHYRRDVCEKMLKTHVLGTRQRDDDKVGLGRIEWPQMSSSRYGNSHPQGCESKEHGLYRHIWTGNWEDYDPWNIAERMDNGIDSMQESSNNANAGTLLQVFKGMLALESSLPTTCTLSADNHPVLRTYPIPLKMMTAFRLLRPIFCSSPAPCESEPSSATPSTTSMATPTTATSSSPPFPASPDSLQSNGLCCLNNALDETPTSPGGDVTYIPYTKHSSRAICQTHRSHQSSEVESSFFLDETMLSISHLLSSGDYVVWHPDVMCGVDHSDAEGDDDEQSERPPSPMDHPQDSTKQSLLLSIPICPLTRDNALFLVRQRRSFVLGFPSPDFAGGYEQRPKTEYDDDVGESLHLGRPGVQQVHDVGGEEALRAMGLLAWDEDASQYDDERYLLRLANSILYPDLVPALREVQCRRLIKDK